MFGVWETLSAFDKKKTYVKSPHSNVCFAWQCPPSTNVLNKLTKSVFFFKLRFHWESMENLDLPWKKSLMLLVRGHGEVVHLLTKHFWCNLDTVWTVLEWKHYKLDLFKRPFRDNRTINIQTAWQQVSYGEILKKDFVTSIKMTYFKRIAQHTVFILLYLHS